MTRNEIVDAVNRLSVGYNVTWNEISSDADEAIHKINSYLGVKYPLMSEILTAPDSIYALKHDGRYLTVFPDIYIKTIVIPFIATKILSRDEEFTTIYNKYAMDVEDGLYTMFSNEFNRVHPLFIQDDTTGVFFSDDFEHAHPELCHRGPRLKPKFSIRYHMNNPSLIYTSDTIPDLESYDYEETYTLRTIDTTLEFISTDRVHYYTFAGWYTQAYTTSEALAPTSGTMLSDIDVYAGWNEYTAIEVVSATVTINNIEKSFVVPRIRKIIKDTEGFFYIPKIVGGFEVTGIVYTDCYIYVQDTVHTVTKMSIPYFGIKYIEPNFFCNFENLEIVRFHDNFSNNSVKHNNTIIDKINLSKTDSTNNIDKYVVDNIQLDWSLRGCLSQITNKVETLTIPNSVSVIEPLAFIHNGSSEGNGFNTTTIVFNTEASVLNYIEEQRQDEQEDIVSTKKVEVKCDWMYANKPSTFNLPNNAYILELRNDLKACIYHITYMNPTDK